MTVQAAPAAFNWLVAVWIPLGAAALGGVLSAMGAVAAIAWQGHEGRRSTDKVAGDLFLHLVSEQGRLLTRAEQYRSQQAGNFAFLDVDKIQANYGIFERNREWLVRLRDESLRSAVSDALSEIQVWATVSRNAATDLQAANAVVAKNDFLSPDHATAVNLVGQSTNTLNVMFAELPRLRADCDRAALKLKELA